MFVPLVAMLCAEKNSYCANVLKWTEPTNLAISKWSYTQEEAEELATKNRCVLLFFPVPWDGPAFFKESRKNFHEKCINGWEDWLVADEAFSYKHWQLSNLQYFAKEALEKNAQDCHSKEYNEWLKNKAVYYNNGFYEWEEKHYPLEERWMYKPLRGIKECIEIINKNCKTLYTASMKEGVDGGTRSGSCTIVERKGKYIAFGEGGEICYSDCMSFYMFWQEDSLEELKKKLERNHFKLKSANEDANERFVRFVKRHNPEEFSL